MGSTSEAASRISVGRTNRRAVLKQLALNGVVTRTEIAKHTGLTAASISRMSRELIEAGVVREVAEIEIPGRAGRRSVALELNPDAGCIMGIGINAFAQVVTLANLANHRLERIDLNLPSVEDPELVLDGVVEAARSILHRHPEVRNQLLGVGVAVSGAVIPSSGEVVIAPAMGWRQVSVGRRLTAELDMPVRVESLANSLNLSEIRFGIARGKRNTLLVNAALGIGASIYVDGRLARGHAFACGLVGNLALPQAASELAATQTRRTLDQTAGGWAVLQSTSGAGRRSDRPQAGEAAKGLRLAVQQGESGDATMRNALAESGAALGCAVGMFAGLMHPETIIISGPLSKSHDYIEACRSAFLQCAGEDFAAVEFLVSEMTGQAAARWLAIGEYLIDRDLDLERFSVNRS